MVETQEVSTNMLTEVVFLTHLVSNMLPRTQDVHAKPLIFVEIAHGHLLPLVMMDKKDVGLYLTLNSGLLTTTL